MIGDFGLQNPCLRRRVCARSRAAGDEFMNQIIDTIEKEQQKSDAKTFSVGDSVRVHTRVVEGDKERIQIFAGVVIGRKGRGLNGNFHRAPHLVRRGRRASISAVIRRASQKWKWKKKAALAARD